MTPLETLHKKTATKQDLRQALATTLNVSAPVFETPKQRTGLGFKDSLSFFVLKYYETTGIVYSVSAKDGKALKEILIKIEKIAKKDDIYYSFVYLIRHLPQWYIENGFSLPMINSKFNEIIASIKQQKNISDGYKESIINDLS